METPIPSVSFSRAKAHLSDVMTDVVHQHHPRLVNRHGWKESMLLMRPDDLARLLRSVRFEEPRVVIDEGEVTLRLAGLGLLGFGETLDQALDDLLEELRAYAHTFFGQLDFYLQTDRADHALPLLRFALASDEEQRQLLAESVEREADGPVRA